MFTLQVKRARPDSLSCFGVYTLVSQIFPSKVFCSINKFPLVLIKFPLRPWDCSFRDIYAFHRLSLISQAAKFQRICWKSLNLEFCVLSPAFKTKEAGWGLGHGGGGGGVLSLHYEDNRWAFRVMVWQISNYTATWTEMKLRIRNSRKAI